MAESKNSFGAKKTLEVGGKSYDYFALDAVEGMEKLPYSLKVLGENLLRTEDGKNVTEDHIKALASWDPSADPSTEIQFTPARVLMQDFTGVPCVVDLATMREAVAELGGDALHGGRDGGRERGTADGRHRVGGDLGPVGGFRRLRLERP